MYLNWSGDVYVQLELEHESHLDTALHTFMSLNSVSDVIFQSLLSQTTQLELSSVSVLAIRTNHQSDTAFLVATKYKYSQLAVAFQSHEILFVGFGSVGAAANHALLRSEAMLDTGIQFFALSIHGHSQLTDRNVTIADWAWDKCTLRATSWALLWAHCNLGNNAAARIHTISIITNIGNNHAKTFSRVLVSEGFQYSFSHSFHGKNQRYISTKKLTIGMKKSNCHHHEAQRSWNLLLFR